ncbi:MAG: class I SAM-dependent methyltransferase [Acidimicrobiales bacterium]
MTYADRYDPDEDFDRWYTLATARSGRWIRPGDAVLELGCATGLMTAAFVDHGAVVTAVDHAPTYLERARARELPGATFVEHDIVTVERPDRFRHVVVANVAHEVPDPARLFRTAAEHLVPGGLLHVTLQNPARSTAWSGSSSARSPTCGSSAPGARRSTRSPSSMPRPSRPSAGPPACRACTAVGSW